MAAPGPDHTGRPGHRRAVERDELAGDAVIRLGPIEIRLHQPLTRNLPFLNGAMDVRDRGFGQMEAKRLLRMRLPPTAMTVRTTVMMLALAIRDIGYHPLQSTSPR